MEVNRIDPDEAKRLLDSDDGYRYLDVRSREEFAAGHIPDASNIPVRDKNPDGPGLLPNPNFVAEVKEQFPPDTKLIVGCLRGGRSLAASRMLIAEGYSEIVDMRGGYDGELDPTGNCVFPGWTRRGLPTTTE